MTYWSSIDFCTYFIKVPSTPPEIHNAGNDSNQIKNVNDCNQILSVVFIRNRGFSPYVLLANWRLLTIRSCNIRRNHVESWMNDCVQNDKKHQAFNKSEIKCHIFCQLKLFIVFWLYAVPKRYFFIIWTKVAASTNVHSLIESCFATVLFFRKRFVSVFGGLLMFFRKLNWCRIRVWALVPKLFLSNGLLYQVKSRPKQILWKMVPTVDYFWLKAHFL